MKSNYLVFICLVLFYSCSQPQKEKTQETKPIVEAHTYLHASNLTSSNDLLNKDNWIPTNMDFTISYKQSIITQKIQGELISFKINDVVIKEGGIALNTTNPKGDYISINIVKTGNFITMLFVIPDKGQIAYFINETASYDIMLHNFKISDIPKK